MPRRNNLDGRTLMERGVSGRIGSVLPDLDVPEQPLPSDEELRETLEFPEMSEPEVVRLFHSAQPAQLLHRHQLLPPWKLHHEIQPEGAR